MYSIGIPKDSIIKYETALKAGKFVLVAHSRADEVAKAKELLGSTQVEEVMFLGDLRHAMEHFEKQTGPRTEKAHNECKGTKHC